MEVLKNDAGGHVLSVITTATTMASAGMGFAADAIGTIKDIGTFEVPELPDPPPYEAPGDPTTGLDPGTKPVFNGGGDFNSGTKPSYSGGSYKPPSINLNPPSAPSVGRYASPSFPDAPVQPSIGTVSFTAPTAPAAPSVTGIALSDLPAEPGFEGSRPTIDLPAQPDAFAGIAPTAPTVSFQDSPTVTPFVPPEISTLPDLSIPELSWSETLYDSALLRSVNEKLLGWINGLFSTGIPANVEQAIWNRARERTNGEVKRLKNNVTRSWSAAGWSLPAPSMANALLMAEQEAVNKVVEESRSVAIAQAELEQKNLQFAFQTSLALETQMMTTTNQLRQRLFEAQKANIELMIQTYEIMQKRINLEIEILKARASVWEVTNKLEFEAARQRLEMEKTKVEIFGAQIQAFTAQVQANGTQWDSWAKAVNASLWELEEYKADADVFKAKVESYKGLVDAKRSQAEIEIQSQKLPIDLFQAKVQGFNAEVDAEKTRATVGIELAKLPLEGYKANIQGYASKVDALAKKADVDMKATMLPVEVYKAEVDAFAARAGAEASVAKVQAELQQIPIEIFKAEVQAYVGAVEAEAKRINALVDAYTAEVQAWKAGIEGQTSIVDSKVKFEGIKMDGQVKSTQNIVEVAKAKAQIATQQWTATVAAAEAAGKVAGNIAASAMSALNASGSASIGESVSTSAGYSHDATKQVDSGWSKSRSEGRSWDETKWKGNLSSKSETDSLDEYPPVTIRISQQGQL